MKKALPILLLFSFCSTTMPTTPKALVVIGAYCSGKSTLSKQLLSSLGDQWRLVELDMIEDALKEQGKDTSDQALIDAVVTQANRLLSNGCQVIIDTNIYHEQLQTVATPDKTFILLHCPLAILLERNAQRDAALQRSEKRSFYARQYVEKNFANFEQCTHFDIRLDSSSKSIEPSMVMQAIRQ